MAHEHKSQRRADEHLEQQMKAADPGAEVLGQDAAVPTDPAIPIPHVPAPPHDHSAASRSAHDTRKHHQGQ